MAQSMSSDYSFPTSPSPVPHAPRKNSRFQESWSGVLEFYKSAAPWVKRTETESPSIFLSLHNGGGWGGVVVVNALDSPRALSPGVLSTCTVSNRAERLYGYDGVSVQLLQTFAIRASVHAVHSTIPTLLLAVKERGRERERNGSN